MSLEYLFENWRRVLDLTGEHLVLTGIALSLAILFAIPIGFLAARVERLTLPVLGVLGALYTVPSLAFLAFLIPPLGLGEKPAVVALAVYAQISLVRNIVAGIQGVDRATIEAARGLGMTRWQVIRRIELPLALPVFIAGLRIALVTVIGLATITAWINAGGLGTLLFDGISRNHPPQILAGAIAIVALALLADALMRILERLTPASRSRASAARSG